MKVKEESEKVCLNSTFRTLGSWHLVPSLSQLVGSVAQSCPITSWETDGETVETVADFIFLGSKITADDDCSHEIKRAYLEGKL